MEFALKIGAMQAALSNGEKLIKTGENNAAHNAALFVVGKLKEILSNDEVPSESRKIVADLLGRSFKLLEYVNNGIIRTQPTSLMSAHQMGKPKFNVQDLIEPADNKLTMNDIVGMQNAKIALLEAIVLPNVQTLKAINEVKWNGVLLFGPTGVGKSKVVKALVNDCNNKLDLNITFINVDMSAILGAFHGMTEENITELFKQASLRSPAVLLIDEIDSLMTKRDVHEKSGDRKIKNHLLSKMDGLASESKLVVIGTTNKPHEIDDGFLRRFERRIHVPLPTNDERQNILITKVNKIGFGSLDLIDFRGLADDTYGFSPADLHAMVKQAGCRVLYGDSAKRLLHGLANFKKIDVNQFKIQRISRPMNHEDLAAARRKVTATNDSSLVFHLELFAKSYGTDYDAEVTPTAKPYDFKQCLRTPITTITDALAKGFVLIFD